MECGIGDSLSAAEGVVQLAEGMDDRDAAGGEAGAGHMTAVEQQAIGAHERCDMGIVGGVSDKEDARRMLTLLCGCGSAVHTGICIGYKGKFATWVETAYVTFDDMSPEEIEDYISTDEPYDKAGGYAVQGRAALYIAGVTGDWYSVVGLPIHAVKTLLEEEFGILIKHID